MRNSESPYITPDIKILLPKRYKLCRTGKAEASDFLAMKRNRLIALVKVRF